MHTDGAVGAFRPRVPDLRRVALALAAAAVMVALAPGAVEGGTGTGPRSSAPVVTAKRTGWRRLVPRAPKKVRKALAQASFRTSVGIRHGLVGVGGMGVDVETVVRSKEEAEQAGVKRLATVLSVGPSTAIGTVRVHGSRDRALIPKRATWSYSIGPRSKRSPTQGDGIGIPTLNPFLGITVSRVGGFGIKVAGWPTPLGNWPFTYGTLNLGVNHPALARPSNWMLDRADRFERWMGRVTGPVTRPLKAAAKLVARPAKRAVVAARERTRKPQPGVGARPGTRRIAVDRAAVIGEGASSLTYASRDGTHVVHEMKKSLASGTPVSRADRIELAHRTVGGMELLRGAGLPIPPAWIERGHPDRIVQPRVTGGFELSQLRGIARLRARAALVGLRARAARQLWPRRTFGWIDATPRNVRFDTAGRVVTWFAPVSI
jgi:hypothetical protein